MVGDEPQYVEAVVEKDGKIAFTGNLTDTEKFFPDASKKDLEGRTMMPGHIDPHLHPSMAALILQMHFITPFEWVLPSGKFEGVRNEQGYRQRLSDLILKGKRTAKTDFLITWGYHQYFHGEMSRKVIDELNDMSNKIPVVVWHRSFHEVYLNSYALDHLQYDDKDKLMQNDQVEWDRGHFFEMGLDALLSTTSFKDTVFPMMIAGYNDLVQVRNKIMSIYVNFHYFA